jgi:hypothetical protein
MRWKKGKDGQQKVEGRKRKAEGMLHKGRDSGFAARLWNPGDQSPGTARRPIKWGSEGGVASHHAANTAFIRLQ